jgi:nitroreductase/ketosteroid isomerase-like protein
MRNCYVDKRSSWATKVGLSMASGIEDRETRNRRIALEVNARMGVGELDSFLSLFADDPVWRVPRSTRDGRDGIAEMFRSFRRNYPYGAEREIQSVLADGHLVAIQQVMTATTASGANYQNESVKLFEFDDEGRVQAVSEYLDTERATDTLRGGPQSPDALLTTTRAVRKRLDLDRPVDRSVIEECLRLAFQAPTGANSQGWGWVVVDDPKIKQRMAEIYRSGFVDHQNRPQVPESPPQRSSPRMSESVVYLGDNLQRVPVLVVPTIDRRYGDTTTFQQASRWGSILPAVWSFMLALRSRGLGSAWTTIHLYREEEMADLLGIPYPEQTQAGLFPVAFTIGSQFSPADRSSSESRIFWNRWIETQAASHD